MEYFIRLVRSTSVATLDQGVQATEITNYRQERGAALARAKASAFRHIAGESYLVPSATSGGASALAEGRAAAAGARDQERQDQRVAAGRTC